MLEPGALFSAILVETTQVFKIKCVNLQKWLHTLTLFCVSMCRLHRVHIYVLLWYDVFMYICTYVYVISELTQQIINDHQTIIFVYIYIFVIAEMYI